MRKSLALAVGLTLIAGNAPLYAKGLDALADKSPEETDEAAKDAKPETETGSGSEAAAVHAEIAPSASSQAMAQKLFLATSFGWAKASKRKGAWKSGGGMSDLSIGYRVLSLSDKMNVAATYRYAPIAVSGTEDMLSYRGVWEAHYLGGRLNYLHSSSMALVGTAEAGYVVAHVRSVEGLEAPAGVQKNGAAVALGGGADFLLMDKGALSIGPRLIAGVGSFTTIQLAAAAGFLF